MKKINITLVLICFISICIAQKNLPTDYLSKEFHQGRRDAFRDSMPPNSVAVIFAYPERGFSNDVNYFFHQNPDLYYLSGYKESNAVLMLFKDWQGKGDTAYNEIFFVQERNERREQWLGKRLGIEGTTNQLGFKKVYEGKDFKNFVIDYKKFGVVIQDELPIDIKGDGSGYDLFGLLQTFKASLLPEQGDIELHKEHLRIKKYLHSGNLKYFVTDYQKLVTTNNAFKNDAVIIQVLSNPDSATIEKVKANLIEPLWGTDYYQEITNSLREIKTPEELVLLRKSIKISCLAHTEAMKAVSFNMSENEIEGIHRYIHKTYGAEDEGYPPIVGAGANGCILHYETNNSTKIENQLLLMDVGAAYHGYSADVTRTIPAIGKFTTEQKAIYNLVYEAQEEIFKLCKEGTPFSSLNKKAKEILSKGLVKLGIIKDESEVNKYYPHGCSHYLGLDVHDKGNYSILKTNMVITVEPGIYIPQNSPCDKKWWNIGVRIEDDVLITKDRYEILSIDAPRKWDDIEKMATQKSKFKEMSLQAL